MTDLFKVPQRFTVEVTRRKFKGRPTRYVVDSHYFEAGQRERKRQKYATKEEADGVANAIRTRLTAGLSPFETPGDPAVAVTVLDVLDFYRARKADAPISDRGDQHRAAIAKTALGKAEAEGFVLADLEGYLAEREASPATCGKDFRYLKAALAYAKAHAKIARHYFEVLAGDKTNRRRLMPSPPLSVGKPIPPEHFEAILAKLNPRARRAVLFARKTGCRKGEVAALDWKQLGKHGFEPIIQKGSKPRFVSACQEILGSRGIGLVFGELGSTAGEIAHALTACWRYAVKEAEVGHYRFHDLRHSYGTDLVESGKTYDDTAAIMGISSLMARVYGHRDDRRLQIEEIERAEKAKAERAPRA